MYSAPAAAQFEYDRRSLRKKSLCQRPFERMVAAEGLLEGGLYRNIRNVRFSAKRPEFVLPICFYSLLLVLIDADGFHAPTGIAGVKAIL